MLLSLDTSSSAVVATSAKAEEEDYLKLFLAFDVMFSLDSSSMLRIGSSFRLGFCCNALRFCNTCCNLWSQLLQNMLLKSCLHSTKLMQGMKSPSLQYTVPKWLLVAALITDSSNHVFYY